MLRSETFCQTVRSRKDVDTIALETLSASRMRTQWLRALPKWVSDSGRCKVAEIEEDDLGKESESEGREVEVPEIADATIEVHLQYTK